MDQHADGPLHSLECSYARCVSFCWHVCVKEISMQVIRKISTFFCVCFFVCVWQGKTRVVSPWQLGLWQDCGMCWAAPTRRNTSADSRLREWWLPQPHLPHLLPAVQKAGIPWELDPSVTRFITAMGITCHLPTFSLHKATSSCSNVMTLS